MNNLIDERIRDLAKKSVLKLPQDYDMDVTRMLNSLSETEKPQRFVPFSRVVIMAASFVFVFTIGVYATINYVKQRMEAMNNSEKGHYVEGVQDSAANADRYSRPLTETEEDRLKQLKTEYESKGNFPKDELLQVDFVNEVPEDTLCFVVTTSSFYFPEREMTDDELLQFIDLYYKRDYSVQEAFTEKITDHVIADYGITEKSVIQTAGQLLMEVYGIDLEEDDYSVKLVHNDAEVMNDIYWIEVPKLGEKYIVSIDAESGLLRTLQYDDLSETIPDVKVDESSYLEKYEDAKELLLSKIAQNETISKAYLEYAYNNDYILRNGEISFYFELKNGTGYMMTYDCNSQSIQSLTYVEDNSMFKQTIQRHSEISQLHDITQKIVDLQ